MVVGGAYGSDFTLTFFYDGLFNLIDIMSFLMMNNLILILVMSDFLTMWMYYDFFFWWFFVFVDVIILGFF